MKSTILQIIVKQWFRDKAGFEVEDSVLDKVIEELTEQPGIFKSTHYESKKDAEAKEESDWISAKDKMPPIHIEGNLPIVQILGHDNVTMEGYHCYMIGVWMTTNNKIVEVTHWKYKNN